MYLLFILYVIIYILGPFFEKPIDKTEYTTLYDGLNEFLIAPILDIVFDYYSGKIDVGKDRYSELYVTLIMLPRILLVDNVTFTYTVKVAGDNEKMVEQTNIKRNAQNKTNVCFVLNFDMETIIITTGR